MEILDNARIVRELTDKGEWGVWGYVEGLIKRIEISEKRCNCELTLNKDCELCEDDCGWHAEGLKTINIDQIETVFDRYWRKGIERLDLDALSKWIIDDSKDKSELSFRLDKIKGIVGDMWSNDDIAQINMLLTGLKANGEPVLRPNGTLHGSIPSRLITVLTLLEREPIENIEEKARKLNMILSSRVHDIQLLISIIHDIFNEAELILKSQVDCSSKHNIPMWESSILNDNEVISVFAEVEKRGLMRKEGDRYYWLEKNELLSYLCYKISLYKEYSNHMREGEYLPDWEKFTEIFIARGRRKNEWVEVDAIKFAEYKKAHVRKSGGNFTPDNHKIIDEIISSLPTQPLGVPLV